MAVETPALELRRMAEVAALERPAEAKRMLVIVNPYATTMSVRLKQLVVYALQGRYEVEAVDTQAKLHATELTREAAEEGYEVVVAFGGDGTVNEAANGLIGSDVPLTCLPGGSTNVFCRSLGIPRDVVDATEHLLQVADNWQPRRVDLGRVNGRHFTFSSGIGLDASVVEQVDAHPKLKSRYTRWYYTYVAVSQFTRKYLLHPPRVEVEVNGQRTQGVTVIVQNADPFTYFGPRPIRVNEGAALDNGTLSLTVLERASALDMPTLIPRLFSAKAKTVQRHRQVVGFPGIDYAQVRALEGTFPLQVDGDFIGDFDEASYGVVPNALTVVA
jgi:diacylglycerol kinase family enzyme